MAFPIQLRRYLFIFQSPITCCWEESSFSLESYDNFWWRQIHLCRKDPFLCIIQTHQPMKGNGKVIPIQDRGSRRLRLQDFKTIGTWKWWGCQLYTLAAFTRKVLLSVRSWVDPRPKVCMEGTCQWKIPMTPLGNEPTTFQLVEQYLNQLQYCVPPQSTHAHLEMMQHDVAWLGEFLCFIFYCFLWNQYSSFSLHTHSFNKFLF